MDLKKATELASLRDEIAAQIAEQLGFDPRKPPVTIPDSQAAEVLDTKINTLAVWRSTGRYDLAYIKVGRLVRYRISDLADFLARRTTRHTSEVPESHRPPRH